MELLKEVLGQECEECIFSSTNMVAAITQLAVIARTIQVNNSFRRSFLCNRTENWVKSLVEIKKCHIILGNPVHNISPLQKYTKERKWREQSWTLSVNGFIRGLVDILASRHVGHAPTSQELWDETRHDFNKFSWKVQRLLYFNSNHHKGDLEEIFQHFQFIQVTSQIREMASENSQSSLGS